MIPKIIHYCWIGGNPLPEMAVKCMDTWKKYCPEYEIKEWNETNYDFHKHPYMKAAYEAGRWGFVPDYARLDIVYRYGGIYLDTDVELLKSFDELLSLSGFAGMEVEGRVNLGQGFGAEPQNGTILKMRDTYDRVQFINDSYFLSRHASPLYQTDTLKMLGMKPLNEQQQVEKMTIFPTDYFCPKDIDSGVLNVTRNTFSIHHFDGSWADPITRHGYHLKWECIEKYGESIGRIIYLIKYSGYIIKHEGMREYYKKIIEKVVDKQKSI